MAKRRWTHDQLRDAVSAARSVRQVLMQLGLREGGGSYRLIQKVIAELDLDTRHFVGQGWNRGERPIKPAQPFEAILVKDSSYTCSSSLKRRLLRAGMLEERCQICGLPPRWRGERLVLRLDHINGEPTDHRLENLRLLCSNCDSQTPTFAGRNKGKGKR